MAFSARRLRYSALALALCLAAGALFAWASIPLPWMIGPLLATAAGRLADLPLGAPRGGRQVGQVIVATALGLYFTPEVSRTLLAYGHFMVAGALLAVGLGFMGAWILHRLTDTDWPTAYFASIPGGAAEMAVLGEAHGARTERIALAQSLRITLIVLTVPAAIVASGARGGDLYEPARSVLDWQGLALILALAAAGGALLARLSIPNSWMLGPLAVAIALTLAGVRLSSIPQPLANLGQLLIGCALGSRFERKFMASAPRFIGAVVASVAAAVGVAFVFALGFAWATGLPRATMLLALTPGGIAEICITAKALRLGVPIVTAFHVVRIALLVTCSGAIFRRLQRRQAAP